MCKVLIIQTTHNIWIIICIRTYSSTCTNLVIIFFPQSLLNPYPPKAKWKFLPKYAVPSTLVPSSSIFFCYYDRVVISVYRLSAYASVPFSRPPLKLPSIPSVVMSVDIWPSYFHILLVTTLVMSIKFVILQVSVFLSLSRREIPNITRFSNSLDDL